MSEEKKEQLMQKVRELKANRERKLKARHKYAQYVESKGTASAMPRIQSIVFNALLDSD